MPYPNREEILKILPAIEKVATKKPSIRILNNNAAPIDRWKYQIAIKLNEFRIKKNFNLNDLSKLFKSDKANLSRILRGHVDNVSIEKMFNYLEIAIIASKNKGMANKFNRESNAFFELKQIRF